MSSIPYVPGFVSRIFQTLLDSVFVVDMEGFTSTLEEESEETEMSRSEPFRVTQD